MINPKYSLTHYYHSARTLAATKNPVAPHIVNLYLDYNCPFSAKLFFKLNDSVIPKLQDKHPNQFQFVFVNVIQPWHSNSVLLHEFSLAVAKLLRDSSEKYGDTNKLFWDLSNVLFKNKEAFYDSNNVTLNRNEIYEQIYDVVSKDLELSIGKDEILKELQIVPTSGIENSRNGGNGATNDVKYFTRYLRGVGAHVTPTVSVDGIINDGISSGAEIDFLIETFEKSL
ncbi:hypothetical protein PICST_34331 [Scheffersomyces stipitis CBS 6054]|uniref:Thioredoxin-like fold domain-containing protein n=1 Tax=Scheffersomyces stipitis (strain ATCC 58785 / CBS 6054 / NBRC 10063 / NRRL Y-11545) TaxID=322104 RepID=A3GGB9_PICST|nr:hypothetical protein PICST_34331 [Scheffersomyces stipitis CBS 6054]EAZ63904.2 hypothetical protein PICST_34331 [Scheffersomyces stipitis CBS 6054]KAG2735646.1 hypothetical protein G9P44_001860 [Scheffersomyces stipitis]